MEVSPAQQRTATPGAARGGAAPATLGPEIRTKNTEYNFAERFPWLSEFGLFYGRALLRHYPTWFADLDRTDRLSRLLKRVDDAAVTVFATEFDELRRLADLTNDPSPASRWAQLAHQARRSIHMQLAGALRISGLATSDAFANFLKPWRPNTESIHVPGHWGTWLDCDDDGFATYLVTTAFTARGWILTAGGNVSEAESVEMIPTGHQINLLRPCYGSEVSWRLPTQLSNGHKPEALYLKRRRDRRPRRLAYNYGRPSEIAGTTVYWGWDNGPSYRVTPVGKSAAKR